MSKGIGGNLQLLLTGNKDLEILDNPSQICHPKYDPLFYSYESLQPLASTSKQVIPSNNANFGVADVVFDVPPIHGQFISGMYLQISLPKLTPTSGTYAAWTDALGYAIWDKIQLELNGVIVDEHIGTYYDLLDELEELRTNANLMVLKSDVYTAVPFNATTSQTLYIPLQFWFNRKLNQALPLLIFQNWQIKVHVFFKPFSQCIIYDGATPPATVNFTNCNLWVDFINYPIDYIQSTLINKEYRQVCELLQYTKQDITANTSNIQIPLNWEFPVKELLFVFVDSNSIANNDYFNYGIRNNSNPTLPPLSFLVNANLYLDGRERYTENLDETYLKEVGPYKYHTQMTNKQIYCMPFGMEEHNQPSGHIDFSRVDNATLYLNLASGIPACTIYVFGVTYRPLTSVVTLSTETEKQRYSLLPMLYA